jgi:hypothetical protein
MTSEDRDAQIADYVHYLDEVGERSCAGPRPDRSARLLAGIRDRGALGRARRSPRRAAGDLGGRAAARSRGRDRGGPAQSVDLTLVMGDQDQYYSATGRAGLERLDARGSTTPCTGSRAAIVVDRGVLARLAEALARRLSRAGPRPHIRRMSPRRFRPNKADLQAENCPAQGAAGGARSHRASAQSGRAASHRRGRERRLPPAQRRPHHRLHQRRRRAALRCLGGLRHRKAVTPSFRAR